MRRPARTLAAAAIVALAAVLPACQHLQNGLRLIQDPAVQQLITDLQALIDLIGQTAAATPETPEARAAMQSALDEQVRAADQLIQRLRDEGADRSATRLETELGRVLQLSPIAPIEPPAG